MSFTEHSSGDTIFFTGPDCSNLHPIPYLGVRVNWDRKPYHTAFKITDENGNRYCFEDAETTVTQDTKVFQRLKLLTELFPDRTDFLVFEYFDGGFSIPQFLCPFFAFSIPRRYARSILRQTILTAQISTGKKAGLFFHARRKLRRISHYENHILDLFHAV